MASERPWLRKERSREGCAPPANTAKDALPPVASGSEISEPQKKIPQMSGGRNCHAELGSPFKAKQSKANQSNAAPNKQTRYVWAVYECAAWSSVSAHTACPCSCWGWRRRCLVCRKAQSAPAVTAPEPGMSTELCPHPFLGVKPPQHEAVERARSCQ